MLESFTVRTFSGRLGEAFLVHSEISNPLDVELISATDLSERAGGEAAGRGRPFSIVFRGPGDVLLPQRTYRIEHTGMGAFDLFLVPIGPDEKGLRYEAVFTQRARRKSRAVQRRTRLARRTLLQDALAFLFFVDSVGHELA